MKLIKLSRKSTRAIRSANLYRGAVNGFKDNLVGTAEMIAHPLETLNAIKEVAVALSSLTSDDIAKITAQLGEKVKTTFTTKDGINSIPYGAGYAVGVIASEIVLGKGAGAALKGLEGIGAIKNLLTKLEDFKAIAKVKVADIFSDEAAALAKKRFLTSLVSGATGIGSPLSVAALKEAGVVAGNLIGKGYTTFAEFKGKLVQQLGKVIEPYAEKLYRESLVSLDLSKGKEILSSSGKLIDEAVIREAKEKVIGFVQENKVKELKEYLGQIGNKYGAEFEKELKNTVPASS